MKRPFLPTVFFLTACGPSQEEKENIAAVTCSIMSETRNMDAALGVEKINDARMKIGGGIAPHRLDTAPEALLAHYKSYSYSS